MGEDDPCWWTSAAKGWWVDAVDSAGAGAAWFYAYASVRTINSLYAWRTDYSLWVRDEVPQ